MEIRREGGWRRRGREGIEGEQWELGDIEGGREGIEGEKWEGGEMERRREMEVGMEETD